MFPQAVASLKKLVHPPAAPPSFADGGNIPEDNAPFLSRLIFQWLSPFLKVGFSRPLQQDDLWALPDKRLTASLTDSVERSFYARCSPHKRLRANHHHQVSDICGKDEGDPKLLSDFSTVSDIGLRQSKKISPPRYDASLLKALYHIFVWRIWGTGLLKLGSDTLKTTTPLLNKVMLRWLSETYHYHKDPSGTGLIAPRGVGYGIGLAFALFAMQEVASITTNHFILITMTTGLSVRTGVIGAIFRKALRLSGRSRLDHSVGQIVTMISTDATRLDRSTAFSHNLWAAPLQITIGIGLLVGNLGYSALVGLGILSLGLPVQMALIRVMFRQRKKGVDITDQRVRLITEVLQAIRLLKYYVWETIYAYRIESLRERELDTIRRVAFARAALVAVVSMIPILAAILSFVTYALSGRQLDVATIFSSLQLFNIIKQPLDLFPNVFASATDAVVALQRISDFLQAEELGDSYVIDKTSKFAIDIEGDFVWDSASSSNPDNASVENELSSISGDEKHKSDGEPCSEQHTEPFALYGLDIKITQGTFVAVVGNVGSGKSSLLSAILGEMRRITGKSVLSSDVAYVKQSPWIMNATLRDNIIFGRDENEEKFRAVVRACCLDKDLTMLPNADYTEIGERGINLSGGQRARVSLARAAYSNAGIVLLDDVLSAVDAYVGNAILHNCLLSGPLAGRTRVLVTHALHVLPKADYIYGLATKSALFSRLLAEYGARDNPEDAVNATHRHEPIVENVEVTKKSDIGLMQAEERVTGSVATRMYARYLHYAGGIFWGPMICALLLLAQGAQVATNIFLGLWTSQRISGFSSGQYMETYAGLGMATSIFLFTLSFSISITCLKASSALFKAALNAVIRSPVSFFDTTPLGRVISRLSRDQDTLDTEVAMTLNQMMQTLMIVLGTVFLVFYTFPYLGIIFVPLALLYYTAATYYRRSSVETKRLDSLMRSVRYAAYSETLTGLSTVRAYGMQNHFITRSETGFDLENRAYYMTISIQRWLGVRLDFLGNTLILGIALFGVGFRNTVDPSKIGVILSYTLTITQVFSELVSTYAQNEQNFNSVERVLHYTTLPSEGQAIISSDTPNSWPEHSEIHFQDVELAYRKDLPLVLKRVTFKIAPGEKVAIVGRTGAGKSSLLQALFRIVDISTGSITIDGHNTATIGLHTLRSRMALVPQDSTLLHGTLRNNLDPQGNLTDAELISTLQRAWLLPGNGAQVDPTVEAKFTLDALVYDEGSNYSAGEKQLLALCRALGKRSRIIVLDEATSSVDVETDAKIQKTIHSEFASSTLLCIAHRLHTIVNYDRVLVMDAGKVAEFDTPLVLFDQEQSILRSLCNEAGLRREDILRIRAETTA
ncbi:multidrug resistance-associated ABC transporter [Irpex rosettiformis]|uniref:Multidrug resistance-associated ABC transporter n=1 Tax=Irpex rosettiformis TaxID=378272 RepID=A0ACB8TVT2_9APHY|nr:multidrug resistance-associated ABC transporter [Irpex rosettiformis]